MGTSAIDDRKAATLTVALCCLVTILEGFDLQAAGVAAPKVRLALDLTPEQLGWFFASTTFGIMLGAALCGRLADRFGRKIVLVVSTAFFGAMSVATGFGQNAEHLLATRFLTGIGLGGALPNLIALTSENTPQGFKNTAVGLLYAGLPTGAAISSLVTVFGAAEDWRSVFFVGGLTPLVAVPLLAFLLPESRQLQAVKGSTTPGDRTSWGVLFGAGVVTRTLLLWLTSVLSLLTIYLLFNWMPSLLVGKGFTHTDASWVQVSFNVVGAFASAATGWLVDRLGFSKVIAAAFGAAALSIWLLANLQPDFGVALVVGAFVGIGMSASLALLYAIAPANYRTESRGTGVGAALTVGRIGSAAGPLLAGALLSAGRTPAEVFMVLIPIITAAGATGWMLSLVMKRQGRNETAKSPPGAHGLPAESAHRG